MAFATEPKKTANKLDSANFSDTVDHLCLYWHNSAIAESICGGGRNVSIAQGQDGEAGRLDNRRDAPGGIDGRAGGEPSHLRASSCRGGRGFAAALRG